MTFIDWLIVALAIVAIIGIATTTLRVIRRSNIPDWLKPISMREWVSKEPPYSSTTYKAIWIVWLWIFTALFTALGLIVLIIVAFHAAEAGHEFEPPEMVQDIYDSWLFALSVFSGVVSGEFYGKRKTHVPYMEAEAEKERAKTEGKKADASTQSSQVNVENATLVSASIPSVAAVPPQSAVVRPQLNMDDESGE